MFFKLDIVMIVVFGDVLKLLYRWSGQWSGRSFDAAVHDLRPTGIV